MWTPGPAPGLLTEVIGLDVTPGSPQESILRTLATTSGGGYRRATASQLQARVIRFDAQRRCERLVKGRVKEIDGRSITQLSRFSTVGTALQSGNEFEASAMLEQGTPYADLVLSWTSPDVTVEPYEVTVIDTKTNEETIFTSEQLERAVGGTVVRDVEQGISLTGGDTETSVALRVGVQNDDDAGTATAAHHHPWRYRIRAGREPRHSAAAAQSGPLYVQFFAPEANAAVSARGPTP